MKSLKVMLILLFTAVIVSGAEYPQEPSRQNKIGRGEKSESLKLCEVSQSGTIGTYLTQVTITCTSKAPTCEMASLGAGLCVRFQITDAYTKLSATVH